MPVINFIHKRLDLSFDVTDMFITTMLDLFSDNSIISILLGDISVNLIDLHLSLFCTKND